MHLAGLAPAAIGPQDSKPNTIIKERHFEHPTQSLICMQLMMIPEFHRTKWSTLSLPENRADDDYSYGSPDPWAVADDTRIPSPG